MAKRFGLSRSKVLPLTEQRRIQEQAAREIIEEQKAEAAVEQPAVPAIDETVVDTPTEQLQEQVPAISGVPLISEPTTEDEVDDYIMQQAEAFRLQDEKEQRGETTREKVIDITAQQRGIDRSEAAELVDQQLAVEKGRSEVPLSYSDESFSSPESLIKEVEAGATQIGRTETEKAKQARENAIRQGLRAPPMQTGVAVGPSAAQTVTNLGFQLNAALKEELPAGFLNQDETIAGQTVNKALLDTGMIDPTTGSIDPRVGNAFAVTFLQLARNETVKEDDKAVIKETDEEENSSDIIKPDQLRGKFFDSIAAKLNPNVGETASGVVVAPGSGLNYDPRAALALDKVFTQIAVNEGLLVEAELSNGNDAYIISEDGKTLVDRAESFLDVINPNTRIKYSLTPLIGGEAYGLDKQVMRADGVSVKSERAKIISEERKIKNNLGNMAMRVSSDSGFAALNFANVLDKYGERNQQGQLTGKFFSVNVGADGQRELLPYLDHPTAEAIGLGQDRYTKIQSRAVEKHETVEDQAKIVGYTMLIAARHAELTLLDALDAANLNAPFYNKWMHAAANGRFHIANSVLNTQNSKLARSLVSNGRPPKFTPGQNGLIEKNWKYIIARNLAEEEGLLGETNVSTSDIGWEATSNLYSEELLQQAARKGKIILAALQNQSQEGVIGIDSLPTDIQNIFSEEGEWHFKIQAYIDAARYVDARSKGIAFEPQVQTEHDGKQNGLAIQAMQLGSSDHMKLVGLLYSDESNVIPEGDFRSKFFTNLESSWGARYADNPEIASLLNSALEYTIAEETKEGRATSKGSLAKDLAKTPLMETAYGKYFAYHLSSARKFLKAHPTFLNFMMDAYPEDFPNELALARELNVHIGNSLQQTLNLELQFIFKQLGHSFSILGEQAKINSPLYHNTGRENEISFGSRGFFPIFDDKGSLQEFITATGMRIPYGKTSANPSHGGNLKQVMDEVTGFFKRYTPLLGTEQKRQYPVLTIQLIDSAIMGKTILDVNKGRGNDPLYLIPVHDALITDASSVQQYHAAANKNFVEINESYSVMEEAIKAFRKAEKKFYEKVNDKGQYAFDGDTDANVFKGMYYYYQDMYNQIKEAEEPGSDRKPSANKQAMLKEARQLGFVPEQELNGQSNFISGSNIKALYKLYKDRHTVQLPGDAVYEGSKRATYKQGVDNIINYFDKQIKLQRERAKGIIKKRAYQYN